MGAMQRRKGRAGEQEVAALIRDWTGLDIRRNWQAQSAEGGADLTGIDGWAVEVKFADLFRAAWWTQTCEQAERAGAAPVLIYRLTGQGRGLKVLDKWRCFVRLADITGAGVDVQHTAEISLRAWLQLVVERLEPAESAETAAASPRRNAKRPRVPRACRSAKASRRGVSDPGASRGS
jgi:hypothetical protein